MNKVILIGIVSAAPELRYTQGGQAVLNLRVETRKEWIDRKSSEKKESKTWHSVTVWGKRGEELAAYLAEGTHVIVEGELQNSSYEKNGEKRYKTEINASSVEAPFVQAPQVAQVQPGNPIPFGAPTNPFVGTSDDIPY
jgi:single-strand DNA-binding protein